MTEENEQVVEGEEASPVNMNEAPREISDYEKKLRKEVARYKEQAQIAENEKASACAAAVRDRDEAVAAARDEARQRVVQAELKAHAVRSGIVDLDGLRLADTSAISVDDTGELQGVEEVIADLQQRKPYLFSSNQSLPVAVTTAQTLRPPSPSQPNTIDARQLSRDAWQLERDRLLAGSR